MKTLILYSKPGCHLCEGLQEKLEELPVRLEIRDITQNQSWFQKYQYEIPVLCYADHAETSAVATEHPLPRLSPRASTAQVAKTIQTHIGPFEA
ncbi:glutaredoxin family protein [cf. Phormidesmis sp. LEGE 11477]|uniref:glutaredoxin family protein n=1 Tax=cf. Phormidesmis sp. LEGE 11477 TaxID=1828680 RepID=UPI0018821B43|nr:glutaredoxin family protein [cf. Phormidesmis sp. LEGE 11477]MBE9060089.1 glutaredoxin family protein [cf. Phormidesmis sp. LEGE 11477]